MMRCLHGLVRWGGAELRIAAVGRGLFDQIADFTGLEVEVGEPAGAAADLVVEDDCQVLIFGNDRRRFATPDDLRAWLLLTVSDVLVSRGEMTILHAAGFLNGGRATLVCGAPWAGKSTFALLARQRGLEVLGDDMIWVHPQQRLAYPCPRPMKGRLVPQPIVPLSLGPDIDGRSLRTCLDGEDAVLYPRLSAGLAPVGSGHEIEQVLHLRRWPGTGVEVRALGRTEVLQAILGQVRSYAPRPLAAVAALAAALSARPNRLLIVGDGEAAAALDVAMRGERLSE